MKKIIYYSTLITILLLTSNGLKAQNAMDFSGNDCNGTYHHLFSDLDAGTAVVLFFYMPNCGSCPPPAQEIQVMADSINTIYPGRVKGYAFPFNNTTTCTYSASWVTTNNIPLYVPMDSGATMVAHYGGFGMPTVVLVGGSNHRVMFTTLAFTNSDVSIMRDSILALINSTTTINELPAGVSAFSVYPNPVSESISVNLTLEESTDLSIEILDLTGKQVALIADEKKINGNYNKSYNTSSLPNGNYMVRLNANNKSLIERIHVAH